MKEIEKFVNTRYRVLRYLIDNKDKLNIVRCTQDEMGTALSLSRGTINRVLNEFKSDGYIEDNNHYWEYKLTSKAIDVAQVLNLQNNTSVNFDEIKKICRELESIRDYALAGKAPKWYDADGNPTEYYDYEMSNAAINDIYEVAHSLKVLIDKIENVNEKSVEEVDDMSDDERMRHMMVAAKQQMLLYQATHEHKPRCYKCVYETTCSKDKDSNNTCPDYKRDAPDGGYYG